jgi:glycosyltransferase involved in cell wall biosynthesis
VIAGHVPVVGNSRVDGGRRLSVLLFTTGVVRGGVEEHMLTLLRGLSRERFRLHLGCPPALAERLAGDVPEDVELLRIPLRSPRDVGGLGRLWSVLRERRIDIIHSHQFRASLVASPLAWLCRVPVIIETPHLREWWRQGFFTRRFVVDRLVGRFVDHYIANCEANARYLRTEKGLPGRKMVLIYNGSRVTELDPDRAAPAGLRERLGFAGGDTVAVVLGRLDPQKGHTVLLDAFAQVYRELPTARLVCVGDGDLRAELEAKTERLGLGAAVRFVGFQTNVADWLALADFTVLPSLFEGMPLAPIESLAAGRAVVATAVDGTPEAVIDGVTGLTVPVGDVGRLADAIVRLARDPDLRRRFGREGRKLVETRFNEAHMVEASERFYLKAWNERTRGLGHVGAAQPVADRLA